MHLLDFAGLLSVGSHTDAIACWLGLELAEGSTGVEVQDDSPFTRLVAGELGTSFSLLGQLGFPQSTVLGLSDSTHNSWCLNSLGLLRQIVTHWVA